MRALALLLPAAAALTHKTFTVTAPDGYVDLGHKVKAMISWVAAHITTYDYLLKTDVDTLVTNMETRLEEYAAASGGADMIISEDWNGVNTGVFLLKVCCHF